MSNNLNHKTFGSFNFDGVKINGVKAGVSGMKFGNLQNAQGDRITIETPAMRIAWNAEPRTPPDQPDGNVSAKLALSFKGKDSAGCERVKAFYDFLAKMDKRVLDLVKEQRGELWSKSMPDNKVEGAYQPSIKEPSNPKYDPTFCGKIPLVDNPNPESDSPKDMKIMKMSVFNTSRKPISPLECKATCLASAIMEASYVWVSSAMVGVTWTVKSVLVKPKKNVEEFQFTEMDEFGGEGDEEDDDDDTHSQGSSRDGVDKRKREEDDDGHEAQGHPDLEDESAIFE